MTVPTSCPLGTRLVHLINIADSFQRFRYFKKNHQKVLNDISLSIGSGETVGIIGSTGSGKSTLISLISRLYDADEGRVLVDTHASGDVMSCFTNDVDTGGEMLNTTLIQIISGAVTIIGTVILMPYTSLILGAITLIMTPFLTWISKKIVERGRSAYRIQQKTLGMLNGFSEETISGQKVIKIFNSQPPLQVVVCVSPHKGYITARPKGRYRKLCHWSAIKRYSWNLLFLIPQPALLYISALLHL